MKRVCFNLIATFSCNCHIDSVDLFGTCDFFRQDSLVPCGEQGTVLFDSILFAHYNARCGRYSVQKFILEV
jgi:hypothetical protein